LTLYQKIQYVWCKNWLYCFKKQRANAAMKFAQARLSPPTFAQVASEAALIHLKVILTKWSLSIESEILLITELHKIEGAKVAPRSFLLYRWTPIENADDFARWLLESYDLDGETVMVAPAAGFYSLLE
jgi:aspartate aminotransferase